MCRICSVFYYHLLFRSVSGLFGIEHPLSPFLSLELIQLIFRIQSHHGQHLLENFIVISKGIAGLRKSHMKQEEKILMRVIELDR